MKPFSLISLLETIYILIVLITILKIIVDTRNPAKSLGYILAAIFIPVLGIYIYFSFGVNYRKQKFYKRKHLEDISLYNTISGYILEYSELQLESHLPLLEGKENMVRMVLNELTSPLCKATELKLLINGEQKFEEVIKQLKAAKHHIHIQYYIYEDDRIGNRIKDLLIQKVKEGIAVRFIYDDFGSHSLNKRMVKELKAGGVEVHAFYKIRLYALANRMNYRNHQKIIVIDGNIGFVGGINVEDKYINDGSNSLFWRDTHLMIRGQAVISLQYAFISNWDFCTKTKIPITSEYFPLQEGGLLNQLVQITTSGPDSDNASIMLSCMGAIMNSKKRLYITSPYFIPNDTIVDAIKYASLSGIDVRLLVPGISDSRFVNWASCSYYAELLKSGVRIYRYQKGFVHAKTIVSDDNLSIIGSANMDIRSFDLDFEINANVFSKEINEQLTSAFMHDLENSTELNSIEWEQRSQFTKFAEVLARLLSPLL